MREADLGNAALARPALEGAHLGLEQRRHPFGDGRAIPWCTRNHLFGEHLGALGARARVVQLGADVTPQRLLRVVAVRQVFHARQPLGEHVIQHPLVQRLLAREVVQQVVAADADGGGNALQRGALKTELRKLVLRLGEDALLLEQARRRGCAGRGLVKSGRAGHLAGAGGGVGRGRAGCSHCTIVEQAGA